MEAQTVVLKMFKSTFVVAKTLCFFQNLFCSLIKTRAAGHIWGYSFKIGFNYVVGYRVTFHSGNKYVLVYRSYETSSI